MVELLTKSNLALRTFFSVTLTKDPRGSTKDPLRLLFCLTKESLPPAFQSDFANSSAARERQ